MTAIYSDGRPSVFPCRQQPQREKCNVTADNRQQANADPYAAARNGK